MKHKGIPLTSNFKDVHWQDLENILPGTEEVIREIQTGLELSGYKIEITKNGDNSNNSLYSLRANNKIVLLIIVNKTLEKVSFRFDNVEDPEMVKILLRNWAAYL